MRPTKDLGDIGGLATLGPVKRAETGITIGMQEAAELGQMPARMLALAIGRIAIDHRRRCRSGVRPLVAQADRPIIGRSWSCRRPAPAPGPGCRRRVKPLPSFVIADRRDERCGEPHRLADPVGHHRAVEIDPVAGINAGLAIQGQVIAILANEDVREQPRAWPAALDRQSRHRLLYHALAAPAVMPGRGSPVGAQSP